MSQTNNWYHHYQVLNQVLKVMKALDPNEIVFDQTKSAESIGSMSNMRYEKIVLWLAAFHTIWKLLSIIAIVERFGSSGLHDKQ